MDTAVGERGAVQLLEAIGEEEAAIARIIQAQAHFVQAFASAASLSLLNPDAKERDGFRQHTDRVAEMLAEYQRLVMRLFLFAREAGSCEGAKE